MRAVHRLKGIGWLLSCVVVVLGCYMISLSVASERNKLARVDAQIAQAERDLRSLGTEFDTRANLAQLERWNGQVLSLTAPTAGQYVRDESHFAALVREPGMRPTVQMANLVVPAGLTPIMAANAAALTAVAKTPPPPKPVAAVAVADEAPAPVVPVSVRTIASVRKAQAVALLDRQLLSDSTLAAIASATRREMARGR